MKITATAKKIERVISLVIVIAATNKPNPIPHNK